MLISKEDYARNNSLDVSSYIEKKDNGKFIAAYISWANAQLLLKTHHPSLSVDFEKVNGNPVFQLGSQSYVLAFLTDGEKRSPSLFYPIWDNRFNPIDDASVWDANNAIQRATAKVIALETGLGLCCYIGEDLQDNPSPAKPNKPKSFNNETIDPAKWEEVVMPFGKHKGKTLADLKATQSDYLDWLLRNDKDPSKEFQLQDDLHAAIKAAFGETVEEANPQPEQEEDEDLKEDVPF